MLSSPDSANAVGWIASQDRCLPGFVPTRGSRSTTYRCHCFGITVSGASIASRPGSIDGFARRRRKCRSPPPSCDARLPVTHIAPNNSQASHVAQQRVLGVACRVRQRGLDSVRIETRKIAQKFLLRRTFGQRTSDGQDALHGAEHFDDGDAVPVYRRFRDHGRLAPQGLSYLSVGWTRSLNVCYQLMETDNPRLLGSGRRPAKGRWGSLHDRWTSRAHPW